MIKFISFLFQITEAVLFFFPLITVANANTGNNLMTRLESLLKQQQIDNSVIQKIILKTPEQLLPDCQWPQLYLTTYGRLSGNMNVTADCDERRFFLKIHVQSWGDYWTAARTLPAGTFLGANDVIKKHGELAGQFHNVVFATKPITGLLTTRTIQLGQPLTSSMLRLPWKIRQGSSVSVISYGPGFQVKCYGKAMNNAAVGESLRVRLSSGRIISGTVNHQGNVMKNI